MTESPPDPFEDPQALTRESRWIRGLALGLVHDPTAADDVVQEVALRSLTRPAGLSGPRLRAWLATVTRRRAMRLRRREIARREL